MLLDVIGAETRTLSSDQCVCWMLLDVIRLIAVPPLGRFARKSSKMYSFLDREVVVFDPARCRDLIDAVGCC